MEEDFSVIKVLFTREKIILELIEDCNHSIKKINRERKALKEC